MSGMRIPLLFALTLAATPVAADLTRDQALQLGKDFGNSSNTGVSDAATNPDLSAVPDYQGTKVPETQYYGSGLGIEDAARQAQPLAQRIGAAAQGGNRTREQRQRHAFEGQGAFTGEVRGLVAVFGNELGIIQGCNNGVANHSHVSNWVRSALLRFFQKSAHFFALQIRWGHDEQNYNKNNGL